jgi:hypothetical protein
MRKLIVLLLVWMPGWAVMSQECCGHDHLHEKTAPYLNVHTDVRVHADQVYEADDPKEKIFNLKTHTHVDLEFSPEDAADDELSYMAEDSEYPSYCYQ